MNEQNLDVHALDLSGRWKKIAITEGQQKPTLSNGVKAFMISSTELCTIAGTVPEQGQGHQRMAMEVYVLRFQSEQFESGSWHLVSEWTTSNNTRPAPRVEPHVANIGNGRALMIGGRGSNSMCLQDAWLAHVQRSGTSYNLSWTPITIVNPLIPAVPLHMFPSCSVEKLLVFCGVRTSIRNPTNPPPANGNPAARKVKVVPPKEVAPPQQQQQSHQRAVPSRPSSIFINQERPLSTIGNMSAFSVASEPRRLPSMRPVPIEPPQEPKRQRRDLPMLIFVLDLQKLYDGEMSVKWIQANGGHFRGSPEMRAYATLNRLDNGLCLFGGVKRTFSDNDSEEDGNFAQPTNDVYMLK